MTRKSTRFANFVFQLVAAAEYTEQISDLQATNFLRGLLKAWHVQDDEVAEFLWRTHARYLSNGYAGGALIDAQSARWIVDQLAAKGVDVDWERLAVSLYLSRRTSKADGRESLASRPHGQWWVAVCE